MPQQVTTQTSTPVLLQTGFRPFFLCAGPFGFIVMALWLASYGFGADLTFAGLPASHWHAHEMIFGYTMAVIAGFLLTAVRNWTGRKTLDGLPLAALVGIWLAARVCLLYDDAGLLLAAALDVVFGVALFVAVLIPIGKVKQWKQAGILVKVALLTASNAAFYLGAMGVMEDGVRIGLYSGLYLVLGLVLTISRRVMPFFIEAGVPRTLTLRNNKAVDVGALIAFVVLYVADVWTQQRQVAAVAALVLVGLHSYRLAGWHVREIWTRPLLWSLFLAYAGVIAGFALYPLSVWSTVPTLLVVHAFAIGGIGLVTVAMMARVITGHTGRNVREPSKGVGYALALVALAAIVRVATPLLWPEVYRMSVIAAQLLWLAGFAGFSWIYVPLLVRPRVDGRPG